MRRVLIRKRDIHAKTKVMRVGGTLMSLLLLISLLTVTACEKKAGGVAGGHASSSQTGVEDLLQSALDAESQEGQADFVTAPGYTGQTSPEAVSPDSSDIPEETIPTFTKNEEGVEIDLTALSSAAVYSMVYNMTIDPDTYVGKTVKMRGDFATAYDEKKDIRYFACIIKDATACCAQGIEFEPDISSSYPDGFPQEGEECTVIGVFDVYLDEGYPYMTLRNAKFCAE